MSGHLEFRHVIVVNDPSRPDLPQLTANQLWEGLRFRVRRPDYFNEEVEQCTLESIDETHFRRTVKFGSFSVDDIVTLIPPREVLVEAATGAPLSFSQRMTIEHPAPGLLVVAFAYHRDSANGGDGLDVDGFLQQAYLDMDREAIHLIRELAATGAL